MNKKKDIQINIYRNYAFMGMILFLALILIVRIFYLSVYRNSDFLHKISLRTENVSILKRGNIYIKDISNQDKKIVATNRIVYEIIIDKSKIVDTAKLLNTLSEEMNYKEVEKIKNDLANAEKSLTISEGITREITEKISKMKLEGVRTNYRNDRFYPYDQLASNVLGFVGYSGYDRVGQYGVESYYNDILSGKNNDILSGSLFNVVKASTSDSDDIDKVADLNLTIDFNIQSFIEKTSTRLKRRWAAESVTIIVQDPKSGAILGMVSSPSFNPNYYKKSAVELYANDSVQSSYEPGSSFKPFTIAGALDTKSVTTKTTYLDKGEYNVDGFTIKNYDQKAHGRIDMAQVLQKSLNTGTIFAKNRMGDDNFLNYVVRFGFGDKTGIDLAGEVGGSIANLYTHSKSNFATATFGQGIAVTPIQLINAYSALANGGHLLRPYVVESIKMSDGKVFETRPKVLSDVILPTTSKTISEMLVGVVDYGFDHARIKGYDIAGKTGTAQIASDMGGYLPDGIFIHNFVGYAPASDPKFTILIKMVKPQGITFAADSLSSYFAEISNFLIQYLNIKPTR